MYPHLWMVLHYWDFFSFFFQLFWWKTILSTLPYLNKCVMIHHFLWLWMWQHTHWELTTPVFAAYLALHSLYYFWPLYHSSFLHQSYRCSLTAQTRDTLPQISPCRPSHHSYPSPVSLQCIRPNIEVPACQWVGLRCNLWHFHPPLFSASLSVNFFIFLYLPAYLSARLFPLGVVRWGCAGREY